MFGAAMPDDVGKNSLPADADKQHMHTPSSTDLIIRNSFKTGKTWYGENICNITEQASRKSLLQQNPPLLN